MRRVIKALLVVAAAALVYAPVDARAEGYVSPWAGVNFAGGGLDNGRGAFGVQAGGMGAGIIGGEVDFGYSPSAFGTQNDFGHNSVINLMGNVIVGVPVGGTRGAGIRPFATAGLGLIRRNIEGGPFFPFASTNNNFGWNAGAGVMGFFSDHVGLRGDIRYLRTVVNNSASVTNIDFDNGDFHFWRAAIGVVLR